MSFIEQQAARMQAKADQLRPLRADHQARIAQEQAELNRPMADRVRDAIAKMPLDEVEAGIRLEALAEMLPGKYKGHAQPKEVGAALRELGYVRVRSWRKAEEGFRSTWHKSTTEQE